MWGYPTLTIASIATMLAILAAMAFIPDQRAPLLFGILSASLMLGGYYLRRRFGPTVSAMAQRVCEG
jgi:GABA permease